MITLEVCAANLASVQAAKQGGAQRFELCTQLEVDGLTPPEWLMRQARQVAGLRMHVLVRPRAGNFVYTASETAEMIRSIRLAREVGADGVVIGALTPCGDIDLATCRLLMDAAQGLQVTFHRAFDACRDPFLALEQIVGLGCHRLLTSGQAPTAQQGVETLRQLVARANGRMSIMPGAGVNAHNATQIVRQTGARELHGSFSTTLPDGSRQTNAAMVSEITAALVGYE